MSAEPAIETTRLGLAASGASPSCSPIRSLHIAHTGSIVMSYRLSRSNSGWPAALDDIPFSHESAAGRALQGALDKARIDADSPELSRQEIRSMKKQMVRSDLTARTARRWTLTLVLGPAQARCPPLHLRRRWSPRPSPPRRDEPKRKTSLYTVLAKSALAHSTACAAQHGQARLQEPRREERRY